MVSSGQLRELGFGKGGVEVRLRQGRLHRVHRGVYAVGHARLGFRGRLWAAVLACGGRERCALSHRAAAAAWDLMPQPAGVLDLITLRSGGGTAALRVHRSRMLRPSRDVVRQPDGLPVTSVAWTLVDLAGVLEAHRLSRVCHRAQILRLLDVAAVRTLLETSPTGARALRVALAGLAANGPDVTRSELEERFLALIETFGLPRPRTNVVVHGYEVDFLWPDARLVAETDGAATHLTPRAFEQDRQRDAALLRAGFRVLRFTWRGVTERSGETAATLGALLSAPRAPNR
ncbi:MAG: DUF559 domain-containing protein, partial [Solirubrobacterales bacterium]|nr:DUF559 domain-containing protein [Solirubrobacterales bacterium]